MKKGLVKFLKVSSILGFTLLFFIVLMLFATPYTNNVITNTNVVYASDVAGQPGDHCGFAGDETHPADPACRSDLVCIYNKCLAKPFASCSSTVDCTGSNDNSVMDCFNGQCLGRNGYLCNGPRNDSICASGFHCDVSNAGPGGDCSTGYCYCEGDHTASCGDGAINQASETCELPNTQNNTYCPQSMETCLGTKLGTRDAYGNCDSICGCSYDSYNYQCVKGKCDASCATDADCNDNNPNTRDMCNLNTCGCQHDQIPYCGDGFRNTTNEQCELPNTLNNNYCPQSIETCSDTKLGIRDSYGNCDSFCGCIYDPYTYSCVKNKCGAQCDSTHTCANTTCLQTFNDYCNATKLVDYNGNKIIDSLTVTNSTANACLDSCSCTNNTVTCLAQPQTYCVAGVCGAQCSVNSDCNDNNPNTIDTCLGNCSCSHQYVPSCGNNILDNGEQCELPNTTNNQYCSQTLYECLGSKRGVRDAYGNCNSICGCIYDPFAYSCIKGQCSAECDKNSDCVNKCIGDVRYFNGACDSASTCACSWSTENCNNDGCYAYENGCEMRDYYCTTSGCLYNYSQRNTDYNGSYMNYCLDNTIRTHREGHDFYCDQTCSDHMNWTDDKLVQNCSDQNGWYTTGNNRWVDNGVCSEKEEIEKEYRDYTCSQATCIHDVTEKQWVESGATRNKNDGTVCDDNLWCTTGDVCTFGECVGHNRDCSGNNLPVIGQCNYIPDNYTYTWDHADGFVSVCDEQHDTCTTGNYNLTHECNVENCSAQCDETHGCMNTTCSQTFNDFCNSTKLVDYNNNKIEDSSTIFNTTSNSCLDSCLCTNNPATCYLQPQTYCVAGLCGATCDKNNDCNATYCTQQSHKTYARGECNDKCSCSGAGNYTCVVGSCGALCDSNDDCKCQNDYCNGTTFVDYPDSGTCGTSGTQGCLCQVGTNVSQPCHPTLIEHDPRCDPCQNVNCSSMNDACNNGVCNSQTGQCEKIPKQNGTSCSDGIYCNGQETCLSGQCVSGQIVNCSDVLFCTVNKRCVEDGSNTGHCASDPRDCSANNITSISTCNNIPDNLTKTWDYRIGFLSICDEQNDKCTTGNETITHDCSVENCGAQCDVTHTCANTTCSSTFNDYCNATKLVDYNNNKIFDSLTVSNTTSNNCLDSCSCTDNSVTCLAQPQTYCVKGQCNATCDKTDDCAPKCMDGVYFNSGSCLDSCSCSYQTENCNEKDGWYATGNTTWNNVTQCIETQQIEKEYRNYDCGQNGCIYVVNETKWFDVNNTRNLPNGTTCDDGLYCDGIDQCISGICTNVGPNVTCSDCLYCTVNERCDENLDKCVYDQRDCSSNNIPGLATCNNIPDNFTKTWDSRSAFVSTCDDTKDECTKGSETITHTCDVSQCGAQCDSTHPCPSNSCSQVYTDYCNATKLVDYNSNKILDGITVTNSTTNTCLDSCSCTNNSASCYLQPQKYCVKNVCGAECSVDSDCNDGNNNTIDSCLDSCSCQHATLPQCYYNDTTGPVTSNVIVNPSLNNGIFNLTGTANDTCSPIKTAKYYVGFVTLLQTGSCDDNDSFLIKGSMNATDGNFNSNVENLIKNNIQFREDGLKFACMKSEDVNNNWGNCTCANFNEDVLPPNCAHPINIDNQSSPQEYLVCGNNAVINATVCDSESFMQGGEYFIDLPESVVPSPWSGVWMNPLYNFRRTGLFCTVIGASLNTSNMTDGTHYIRMRGLDTTENWGKITGCENVSIIKDTTAPTTIKTLNNYTKICNCSENGVLPLNVSLTDGCFYVNNNTHVKLHAQDHDPGSGEFAGNVVIHWIVWHKTNANDNWTIEQSGVSQPNQDVTLTLNDLEYHMIEYWSVDGCGYEETHHFELDIVNNVSITLHESQNSNDNNDVGAGGGGTSTITTSSVSGSVSGVISSKPCVENWTCSDWSACIDSVQTRTCTDENSCGSTVYKPIEQQDCSQNKVSSDTSNADALAVATTGMAISANDMTIGIIVIVVILLIVFFLFWKRKKK